MPSVAVFTRVPIEQIETLALDISSRTSVALTRILCAQAMAASRRSSRRPSRTSRDAARAPMRRWSSAIRPSTIDPAQHGVTKIDLGAEWQALTGLPFVYAMWVGRTAPRSPEQCAALHAARDRGVARLADDCASEAATATPRAKQRALRYLRDNLKYGLGDAEHAGLRRFHELAAEHAASSPACDRCGSLA